MSNRPTVGISQKAGEFESSINQDHSKYDESEKPNMSIHNGTKFEKTNEKDVLSSINKINQLININDGLNFGIQAKLNQLGVNNHELEIALQQIQLQIPRDGDQINCEDNSTYNKSRYLPTPTDEDFSDHRSEQLEMHDIPSSPDIMPSEEFQDDDIDEIEIELNDKISRMVQTNYNDENIMKVKNVVKSALDLLKFENDDKRKLMNMDENVKVKSGMLMERLYRLVESFT